eukprot:CAMPEP_0113690468 /NCGR_PEP_ID=MMETSP0038_2-20120614/17807_1 /TAXON_ID=2898 /ORGANISM="Cryptomonas paramecium" /LENGTH=632 /DNA_ID=CAMNT_0000611795 /DNA_START=148 /DNA_END=2043 /DNA_ORIENTATION=+ /assembly_acc=CAM_ASM_000170
MWSMNFGVDPCEDFYSFACGGFIEKSTIPEYDTTWSLGWSTARQNVEKDTIALLQKDTGEAGTYYRSCMNTPAIEELGTSGLTEWFKAVSEVNNAKDLTDFMTTAELFGFTTFISAGVSADPQDTRKHAVALGRGRITLPGPIYYTTTSVKYTKIRETMVNQISRLFQITGLSESVADESARQVLELETEMVKSMTPKAKLRKLDYKFLTLRELENLCPSVAWKSFFSDLDLNVVLQPANSSTTARTGVVGLKEVAYLRFFESSIASRSDYTAIRAYLRWRVISVFCPYLTEALRAEMLVLRGAIYGTSEPLPPSTRCYKSTLRHLPDSTSRLYVNTHFSRASEVEIRWTLQRVRNEYTRVVSHLDWMDDLTRVQALRKLSAMDFEVGHPARWDDEDGGLPPLQLSVRRYLDNTMALMVRSSLRHRETLEEPVDRHRWVRPPAVVNAFYSGEKNTLFIPAGILQPPFFKAGGPLSRNFGAIGSILGHEISHSLDDSGSRRDARGVLHEWWDPVTLDRFHSRTTCVAQQFSAFTDVEGEHLNGNLTLGETIADSGGLHMAYAAMEEALPDPSPADRRLFFLSFAQLWCRKQRPGAEHAQVLTDPHPPARFRVLGTLADSQDFADAYQCPAGSP